MRDFSNIKALLFDVDNTLTPYIPEMDKAIGKYVRDTARAAITQANRQQLMRETTLSLPEILDADPTAIYNMLKEKMGSSTLVLQMLTGMNIFEITREMEAAGNPAREALQFDQILREQFQAYYKHGFTMATLRNGTDAVTDWILKRLLNLPEKGTAYGIGGGPIEGRVLTPETKERGLDIPIGIISTVDRGIMKPDPDAFRYAIEVLGYKPKDILMVGDEKNKDGACQAEGIQFVHVDRHAQEIHRSKEGYVVIPSVHHLASLLPAN